ncbi:MAG TPA: xanthine dehydrogenase family protein molybdopterin-binding subunit [Spirochaetes bacterium]|nr:xanthine dehydrogenase family protein molybdopterin-binding subunit [Spirochaetota bacterium]
MKKDDESKDLDFQDIEILPHYITRRELLKLAGAGIVIFFFHGKTEAQQDHDRGTFLRQHAPGDFNAFLRIGEDGKVTCFTGKIEMGQGIITSLAQMLAEGLDVPLESVQMVMGDTDLCPWDMGTFGSLSTRYFGPTLVAAAAEARAVLIELGAEALKVPSNRLISRDGFIIDKAHPERKISYSALTRGKRIERHLENTPLFKPVSDYNVVGKPVPRRDAHVKVTGKAQFAGDIRLPGMLYASVLRPTAHGAKLGYTDTSEAENIKGIKIIKQGDLIAALHKNPEDAQKAIRLIKVKFDTKESKVDDKTIFRHLLNVAPQGKVLTREGNIEKGRNLAARIFEETYFNGYVAHAPIETHTAVAQIKGGRATVWASTQTPFSAKKEVAQTLGFTAEKVRIITPFVGGGFGGKSRNQQAVEAALLAQLTGRPVQVTWSREEEFFYDSFRPAAVVKISSGIQNSGRIVFWDYNVYFAGDRGASQFYEIPHHRTYSTGFSYSGGSRGFHPFNTGPWRAPAVNTNAFAMESQIDIMAESAGMDALGFRLNNLKDKRMTRVLKAAAERFGWVSSKAPGGRGYGVACAIDAGTYVAHMAEVEVDRLKGRVQVIRVVCAQDMGLVINPEGAKQQIEGCVTMGLGYALTEEIHFQDGKIFDLNFDTYEIPRFSWLPQIDAVLIDNKDFPPQGGGEPAIACMGAVIANAIYDAVGARLHQLPMTPERVREALNRV